MYRLKIVFWFIYYSMVLRVRPWRYFQLHAKYFNRKKWIFSKAEIESHIPDIWKLNSTYINNIDGIQKQIKQIEDNHSYPVFIKPEWGQNSHGISIVYSREELSDTLKSISKNSTPYVAQQASRYENEFEILYTRDPIKPNEIILQSIVESKNDTCDPHCVNGIHGTTSYHDILPKFTQDMKLILIEYIQKIWEFRVARIGLKAENIKSMIEWKFEIFEINIFIPFALHLLDKDISKKDKNIFIKKFAKDLVILTWKNKQTIKWSIFFKKLATHYTIKLQHNTYYMKLKKVLYAWIEETFMDGCSDYNSLEVRRLCRSKKQARDMFEKNNVPHAKGLVFINPYSAYKFVKQHGFPIVLKPNVWWYSRGSFFPIENFKDFWKAMFFVKLWWPSSVVEQYLLWKNYRIVTTKQAVDIAMERYPAFVVWDNAKTIWELIDDENNIREEMKLAPIIYKIKKSGKVASYIKKQGYCFESILPKWKKISLYYRVSLAPGGILETVEVETITQKNKELFIKILNDFWANIFGIDVIMEKGVEVDYDKQKTIFLEVNSRPYLEMHRKPRYGKPADLNPLHEKLSKLEITGKWTY